MKNLFFSVFKKKKSFIRLKTRSTAVTWEDNLPDLPTKAVNPQVFSFCVVTHDKDRHSCELAKNGRYLNSTAIYFVVGTYANGAPHVKATFWKRPGGNN